MLDQAPARRRRQAALTASACVALLIAGLVVYLQSRGDTRVSDGPVWYDFEVVASYPHDPSAFTQGLIFRDGYLYESTGLNGRSSLRKVDLATGRVLRERSIAPQYFAEGLTDWGGELVQLTWRSNVGFVYDLETFALQRTFSYPGEGWGLARLEDRLVMSDGTSTLRFLDPQTLREIGRVTVTDGAAPVHSLNELEVVDGQIYANVWQMDYILIISPDTGRVTGKIDLSGLLSPEERSRVGDVLNGIAYDDVGKRLFVTGKLWPKLFEIRLKAR